MPTGLEWFCGIGFGLIFCLGALFGYNRGYNCGYTRGYFEGWKRR